MFVGDDAYIVPAVPLGRFCGTRANPHQRRGQAPALRGGTDRPVRWFSACTGGGTRRSRPTNHMGSPFVFVGRHLCVPPCGGGVDDRCIPANPYRTVRKFDGAACGPTPQGGFSWPVGPIHLLWASAPTGCNATHQPDRSNGVHTGGGTNRFYPYGVVHTGGGTHRSRPTRSFGTRFWRG